MTGPTRGLWSAAGAAFAGAAASACCWLPLLLGLSGASAAGVSASFERHRPWLAGLTVVLVATSLTLTSRRDRSCRSRCTRPSPSSRVRRALVWLLGIGALSLAFLPGILAGPDGRPTGSIEGSVSYVLGVDGMTCPACAGILQEELEDVTGVRAASIDLERGRATVHVEDRDRDLLGELLRVVESCGFSGRVLEDSDLNRL